MIFLITKDRTELTSGSLLLHAGIQIPRAAYFKTKKKNSKELSDFMQLFAYNILNF
jgi:hypothetical protein